MFTTSTEQTKISRDNFYIDPLKSFRNASVRYEKFMQPSLSKSRIFSVENAKKTNESYATQLYFWSDTMLKLYCPLFTWQCGFADVVYLLQTIQKKMIYKAELRLIFSVHHTSCALCVKTSWTNATHTSQTSHRKPRQMFVSATSQGNLENWNEGDI